jgi:aminoglycoside phosphotransferase (APT) family kinase protein
LYVNHSVVRAAGSRAAGLLDEIVEVGTRVDVADFHNDDVVHGDFHHRNILVGGDRVTAVVDWEGARAGDARLDIAKLAFWSETVGRFPAEPDAAIYLKGFAELHIPPAVDAALAGLLALQQVNFAARSRPELREWSLEVVERILAPHWRL